MVADWRHWAVIIAALLTWGSGVKNTTEQSVGNNASNEVPLIPLNF